MAPLSIKQRLVCFLVPVLTAVVLLYQVLSSLQIAVMHGATLAVIGITLAVAVAAGLLAAYGGSAIRVGVFVVCALVFLDVTFHLSGVFDHLRPEGRGRSSRDTKRLADIHRIQAGLEQYIARYGSLPMAREYGEATGPETYWQGWWDVSSEDKNQSGGAFLDFLVDGGIMPSVPVDPVNTATDDHPMNGTHYVYFLVPPKYDFSGGACDAQENRWHYMIAITDLEDEPERPPSKAKGSGCECLWRDKPNYFQHHFDYILCGKFDATPEVVARAAAARAKRVEAIATAATQQFEPQDRQRVADILKIKQGFEKYVAEKGPLPAPREYGEADKSKPGFWQGYWDLSSDDGDNDGQPFLDFLVQSGVMPSVPVDPDNEPGADGNAYGGKQYVYFLARADEVYAGGTCVTGPDKWVYLLGVTDLRSETTRPPQRISGSGCDCLWRDAPNFFQKHFDYVVCGTFDATREARARTFEALVKEEAAIVEKDAAAAERPENVSQNCRATAAAEHRARGTGRVRYVDPMILEGMFVCNL